MPGSSSERYNPEVDRKSLKASVEANPLLKGLNKTIHVCVWTLAVMMTMVIVLGAAELAWMLAVRLCTPPYGLLGMNQMLELFGAFLVVLIAIELYVNITLYLREDVVNVRIVLATAFIAIARKIIILDAKDTPPEVMYGVAGLVLAISVGYFLVVIYQRPKSKPNQDSPGPDA